MRSPAFLIVLALASIPSDADSAAIIRGRVLGHDGRPLPKAVVREIRRDGPVASRHARRDGGFEVRLDSTRTTVLWLLGPHHQDATIPVMFADDDTIEVEVRLAPIRYAGRFDTVRVIGEFNAYDPTRAVVMTRRRDGTFVARIPSEHDTLRYQLVGITEDGSPAAGTDSDTFFVRRQWISAVWGRGREVELHFDPRRLARRHADAVARFSRAPLDASEIYRCFFEEERHGEAFGRAYRAFQATEGDLDSFRFDMGPRRHELLARLGRSKLPRVRQYLMLQYLDQLAERADSAFARRALAEVPPTAPAWSLVGYAGQVIRNARWITDDHPLVDAYAARVVDENPDPSVRAALLGQLVRDADAGRDTARVQALLGRLVREHPSSMEAEMALKQYAPDRAIQLGVRAPDFEVPSLDDTTRSLRLGDYKGRHVLVDFWATWCGPCLNEMKHLHAAWDAFHDRGLAILSVSFDMKREAAIAYRGRRWAMPWDQAFAPGGFGHEMAKRYEVIGIPRIVLIGPDARILAVDAPLRGEQLRETLDAVLGSPGGP